MGLNGKTKLTGGVVAAIIAILTAVYSYGALDARVKSVEKDMPKLDSVCDRLTKIETIVERIDKKLDRQDARRTQ